MLKMLLYIFDKKQKRDAAKMLAMIIGGAFVELIGVSAIYPIINSLIDESYIYNNRVIMYCSDCFGLGDTRSIIIGMSFLLIMIYVVKNIYILKMYKMQYKFTYDNQRLLATKLMGCYLNQDYIYHVSKNVSELQRNVINDVNQFYFLVLTLMQFLTEITVCITLAIYLLIADVVVTLLILCLLIIFIIVFIKIFKSGLNELGEKNRNENANINKWILQSFGGIKEIKSVGKERFFEDKFDSAYKRYSNIQKKQQFLTAAPKPILETVCMGGILLSIIIKLCLGSDVVSLISILSVFAVAAMRMLPSVNRLTGYINSIIFYKPSIVAIYNDLIEIEKLKENQSEQKASGKLTNGDIKLENISYMYPETDNMVFENIQLTIKKNSSVAFIGSSGGGKTTLVDVILGLLKPTSGCVKIDDIDINEDINKWHQIVGYIPQNIYLLDDSILNNILFGDDTNQETIQRAWKALEQAQMDEYVKSLDEGIYTNVGERGVKLSGGQRQRIGIARTLYRNPQILIMDEATSALDNKTEEELMHAIDALQGNITIIIIAHRLTSIKNCDCIYELKNGKIVKK